MEKVIHVIYILFALVTVVKESVTGTVSPEVPEKAEFILDVRKNIDSCSPLMSRPEIDSCNIKPKLSLNGEHLHFSFNDLCSCLTLLRNEGNLTTTTIPTKVDYKREVKSETLIITESDEELKSLKSKDSITVTESSLPLTIVSTDLEEEATVIGITAELEEHEKSDYESGTNTTALSKFEDYEENPVTMKTILLPIESLEDSKITESLKSTDSLKLNVSTISSTLPDFEKVTKPMVFIPSTLVIPINSEAEDKDESVTFTNGTDTYMDLFRITTPTYTVLREEIESTEYVTDISTVASRKETIILEKVIKLTTASTLTNLTEIEDRNDTLIYVDIDDKKTGSEEEPSPTLSTSKISNLTETENKDDTIIFADIDEEKPDSEEEPSPTGYPTTKITIPKEADISGTTDSLIINLKRVYSGVPADIPAICRNLLDEDDIYSTWPLMINCVKNFPSNATVTITTDSENAEENPIIFNMHEIFDSANGTFLNKERSEDFLSSVTRNNADTNEEAKSTTIFTNSDFEDEPHYTSSPELHSNSSYIGKMNAYVLLIMVLSLALLMVWISCLLCRFFRKRGSYSVQQCKENVEIGLLYKEGNIAS